MAYSNVLSRLSSRLGLLTLKPSKCSIASEIGQLKPTTFSRVTVSTIRICRSSRFVRLPLQLSCADWLMPLHSAMGAMASARLISSLSIESGSWALVPQGVIGTKIKMKVGHVKHNVKCVINLSKLPKTL